jgi:superfamily I DNA/RNA helicase
MDGPPRPTANLMVLRARCRPLSASALLIIAGVGTGKTNALAHRVAHLIVNGADPRRVLLLTFSRRAAPEMIRRVERITPQALGQNAGVMTGALTWSGTFHAIGARLLREYAHQIGVSPISLEPRARDGENPRHDRGRYPARLNGARTRLTF